MKLANREKAVIALDWLIAAAIAVRYSLLIDFSNIHPHLDEWLLLIFLMFFTVCLLGTPLFCLACFVSPKRGRHFSKEELFVARMGFDAIGAATIYTMLLYFIGLTNDFFSFMVFYS